MSISSKSLVALSLISLALVGAACGKKNTNQTTNQTGTISTVTVPAAGNPGTFIGKLHTLTLTPDDLPAQYGPYTKNSVGGDTYSKDANQTITVIAGEKVYEAQITQVYDGQTYNGSSNNVQVWPQYKSYSDTAAAASEYNNLLQFEQSIGAVQTFSGVGDANYYKANSYGQAPGTTQTKQWVITVLKSNLTATFYVTLDATLTSDVVKSIALDPWMAKVTAYTPGTSADIEAENASGI